VSLFAPADVLVGEPHATAVNSQGYVADPVPVQGRQRRDRVELRRTHYRCNQPPRRRTAADAGPVQRRLRVDPLLRFNGSIASISERSPGSGSGFRLGDAG